MDSKEVNLIIRQIPGLLRIQSLKQFLQLCHIRRKRRFKTHHLFGDRVDETELGGVEGLAFKCGEAFAYGELARIFCG